MTSDPDSLPTPQDPTGPCPRCERVSSFHVGDQIVLTRRSTTLDIKMPAEVATPLTCQGCAKVTIIVSTVSPNSGNKTAVFWWPPPGSGRSRHSAIPKTVADAFGEGERSLSVGAPHAAAAMFRSALAQMIQDKGSPAAKAKGSLSDAVKQMVADGALWTTFGDWADHIRAWGNAGAHPEVFSAVSQEDAKDLRELVDRLLDFLYIQPDKLNKARPTRKS